MNPDLKSRIEEILSEPVKSTTAVSGGCIADSRKLVMNSGRVFFLKQVRDGSSGTFESEACGLEELRKAGAVRIPEVVAQGPDYLLLEWIVEGKESTDSSMEELGFQFAKLHHFSGEIFGFPEDNYLGDSPQSNSPSKNGSGNWPTFYVENRLQFQAGLAEKNGYTTPELQNLLELLYKKIPDLVFIIDTNYESLAIKESLKLGIPIVAILDTNSNPEGINYPIPGNDDARRSIDLYCNLLKETILNAKNDTPTNIEEKLEVNVNKNVDKTINEIDREKLDAKFAIKNKAKLN